MTTTSNKRPFWRTSSYRVPDFKLLLSDPTWVQSSFHRDFSNLPTVVRYRSEMVCPETSDDESHPVHTDPDSGYKNPGDGRDINRPSAVSDESDTEDHTTDGHVNHRVLTPPLDTLPSVDDRHSQNKDRSRLSAMEDISNLEDYSSHLKEKIPIYKLDKGWKPDVGLEIQNLCASNLLNQCRTAFNSLNKDIRQRPEQYMYSRSSGRKLDTAIAANMEKVKRYSAALLFHVDKRDSEITSLKKELSECKKRVGPLEFAKPPEPSNNGVMRAITIPKRHFVTIEPRGYTSTRPPLEAVPKDKAGSPVCEAVGPPAKCYKASLEENVTFLKNDLLEEETRVVQRKKALSLLEENLSIGETEIRSLKQNVKAMQAQMDGYKQTLASRDLDIAAARASNVRKDSKIDKLKTTEQQLEGNLKAVKEAANKSLAKFEALQTEQEQWMKDSIELTKTVGHRDEEIEKLKVSMAEKDAEVEMLWRRIQRFQDGAGTNESRKRMRLD